MTTLLNMDGSYRRKTVASVGFRCCSDLTLTLSFPGEGTVCGASIVAVNQPSEFCFCKFDGEVRGLAILEICGRSQALDRRNYDAPTNRATSAVPSPGKERVRVRSVRSPKGPHA